jgi:hypothetical protein
LLAFPKISPEMMRSGCFFLPRDLSANRLSIGCSMARNFGKAVERQG